MCNRVFHTDRDYIQSVQQPWLPVGYDDTRFSQSRYGSIPVSRLDRKLLLQDRANSVQVHFLQVWAED